MTLREALTQADLATAQATLNSYPIAANFLEYGNFVERQSPTLASIAALLGKTDAEIDAFFIRAAAIKL